MRAASLVRCGQPPVMVDLPVPVAADGEVMLTVTAAPITPLDLLCASGTSYLGTPECPYVPGVQGVGTRDDGTAVWFSTGAGMRPGDGSMAERVAVPVADTVALPSGTDHRLMAALGWSALAAWNALTMRGSLAAGETVLVLGGGGVVGQAAVQLARLLGAGRVVAACRSPGARDRAARAGADPVVPIHDADSVTDLAARLRAAGPFHLVVDPVFGLPAAAALRALRPAGRLVNLGSSAAETAPIDSATLRGGSLRLLGYTNNELTAAQRAETIALIADHAGAGRLTVDHEAVALADVADAWARQAAGRAPARLVLVP
jgi:NADPH:quinone reductase